MVQKKLLLDKKERPIDSKIELLEERVQSSLNRLLGENIRPLTQK